MIIIQSTEVNWSKKSRGMPLSQERNALPDKHLLPINTPPNANIITHQLEANEHEQYQLKSKINYHAVMKKFGNFTFEEIDETLEVSFQYSSLYSRPKRGKHKKKIFTLKPEEVGEFKINYRFVLSGWWYSLSNVKFYYGENYDPCIFLNSSPTYVVDKLADLF